MIGAYAFFAFVATVPVANWMIGNVGICNAGLCVVPVGFGLFAPSGVLVIGLGLVLRDVVHEYFGSEGAMTAILAGAVVSAAFAPPSLAIASVLAFSLAELADLYVYAPLRERRLALAVLASGFVGSIVDSAVFLWFAFGSFDFLAGQVLGKIWMSLLAVPVLLALRRARGS